MILEKARELLSVQAAIGGGYNRSGAQGSSSQKCSASTGKAPSTGSYRNLDWKPCSASGPAPNLNHPNSSLPGAGLRKQENHHV